MLRRMAKRSYRLHAAYKFVKDRPALAVREMALRPAAMADVFRVLPNTMVPLTGLLNAYECVNSVNRDGVEGDIAECGVYAGGCAGLMALADRRAGAGRKILLFDSFEGMPPPTPRDTEVFEDFMARRGKEVAEAEKAGPLFAIGACVGPSRAEVEDFLVRRLRIERRRLRMYEGWFQETIPLAAPQIERLAILRLDGDWYESTKTCLEGLYEKLAPGGYLIIDDYGGFSGCREAISEFFAQRGENPKFIPVPHTDCHYMRKR